MQDQAIASAAPDAALIGRQLRAVEPALGAYLTRQRWFAAHGALPTARFAHVAPLGPTTVWTCVVTEAHGMYQVPLACVSARAAAALPASAVVAPVELASGAHAWVDACHIPAARALLWQALSSGTPLRTEQGVWQAERCGAALPSEVPASRLMGVEQSNTSMVFANTIVKLYRRLEAGANPDLEVSAYLTGPANFPNTPAVLTAWRLHPADGSHIDAGMVQRFVQSDGDGWSAALQALDTLLTTDAPPPGAFAAAAQRLGRITRAMHQALAAADPHHAPAFAPHAARAADVRAWCDAAQTERRRAWALLETQCAANRLPATLLPDAAALLHQATHADTMLARRAARLADDAGLRLRHHGDYHLGQVLALPDDFMVLDFEGEPLRPLAERRALHSPLRDVAGMLRSFAYAAATGETHHPQAAAKARAWHTAMRQAFLAGYLEKNEAEPTAAWLPVQRGHIDDLLTLFSLEKAFYELRYELSHRPTWVGIPMRGIRALLDAP